MAALNYSDPASAEYLPQTISIRRVAAAYFDGRRSFILIAAPGGDQLPAENLGFVAVAPGCSRASAIAEISPSSE
jgi:hypothetical protein